MIESPAPVLTPERRRTLEAVVGRILPGARGPGAEETSAAAAVENAIRHRSMRALRAGFDRLFDRLEAEAAERYAREFSACAPHERDELLRGVERDPSPWTQFLFRYLVAFSLEGLLGDPVHGGNRGFRGWEAIGMRAADVQRGLCRGARGG